jgi:hypothetical protein
VKPSKAHEKGSTKREAREYQQALRCTLLHLKKDKEKEKRR